jgi:hypothetical protein
MPWFARKRCACQGIPVCKLSTLHHRGGNSLVLGRGRQNYALFPLQIGKIPFFSLERNSKPGRDVGGSYIGTTYIRADEEPSQE